LPKSATSVPSTRAKKKDTASENSAATELAKEADGKSTGAEVVSLDKFRKK
jgi:hypothetical protein